MKRKLPAAAVVLLDVLLFAVMLLTFAYFHHVRMFISGDNESERQVERTFERTTTVRTPEPDTGGEHTHTDDGSGYCAECGECLLDTSGMFAEAFPHVFIQDTETVSLTDDDGIREYALANSLELVSEPDSEYIALYRSHDVYVTLHEINTDMYFEGTGRTYYVQYYVYDIYVRNIENIFTVDVDSRVDMEELIAQGEEYSGGSVIAASNGDYIGNKRHCLIAERNGNLYRYSDYVESDVCVLYYDGSMETYTPDTFDFDAITENNPYQIWNFGPELIDGDGNVKESYDKSSYDNDIINSRHPRTALGYHSPGHYSIVVVDGRSSDSQGVRIVQLAQIMKDLGCVKAYNMDGGDSSQSYMLGEYIRIDESRSEQRRLYDIICIGETEQNHEKID